MAKVLLVEDDNNLREIYQARLTAEGYDIVTAQNGEEALVVAKQNKPDLIISDVMMPRISGFEMLDILRNTNELKHTRVIMLTALGQADDQKRANSLGADRYLVKSQVTLEDIVNAAKELLTEDGAVAPAPAEPAAPAPAAPSAAAPAAPAATHAPDPAPAPVTPTVVDTPVAVAPEPGAAPAPAPAPAAPAPAPAAAPATPPAAPAAPPEPVPVAPEPTAPAPAAPAEPAQPQPAPATPAPEPAPAPVAEPIVTPVEPPATPLAAPAPAPAEEPAVAAGPSEPAAPPDPGTVDAAAQGLEAEEAALQAQIASYSNATPDPTASNDQALTDAVNKLNQTDGSAPAPAAVPEGAPAMPPAPTPATPPPAATNDNVQVAGKKIIQPISTPETKPNLNELLAKEEAKDANNQTPPSAPSASSTFDPNTSL